MDRPVAEAAVLRIPRCFGACVGWCRYSGRGGFCLCISHQRLQEVPAPRFAVLMVQVLLRAPRPRGRSAKPGVSAWRQPSRLGRGTPICWSAHPSS